MIALYADVFISAICSRLQELHIPAQVPLSADTLHAERSHPTAQVHHITITRRRCIQMLPGSSIGKSLASALPIAVQETLLGGREVGSGENVSDRAAGNILKRAQHA